MSIVAAVDGDTKPSGVITTGQELASAFGETLVVLHVITDREYERAVENRPNFTADEAVRDAEQVARSVVEATVDSSDNIVYKGRIGTPAEEILDVAESGEVRYLVLGGRKRTPIGKAIFGSTTQSVLLAAETPVVTVLSEA